MNPLSSGLLIQFNTSFASDTTGGCNQFDPLGKANVGSCYLDTTRSVGSAPSVLCNSNDHNAPIAATKPRSTRDKEIGFRCCNEPTLTP